MREVLGLYAIQDRYQHTYPAYVHDHNITFMVDGHVKTYLHLERYSRRKYDNRLPQYLEELATHPQFPITPETEWVFVNSFAGNSMITPHGRLRLEANPYAPIKPGLTPARGYWQNKEWGGYELKAWLISHELAHVASCLPFFGRFHENSLLLHFDGGASQSNFSAFLYRHGQLKLLEYNWDLAYISKLFNDNALSFALMKAGPGEHTSVPGKLMGYAVLGTFREDLAEWLARNDYFRNIWLDKNPFYEKAHIDFGWKGNLENQYDSFLKDIAATFQGIFQRKWLQKVEEIQQQVQADYLYLAGGCALNIVANTQLVNSGWFRDVFIPPACNDSGLSVGAAAFRSWEMGEEIHPHTPFLNNFDIPAGSDYSCEVSTIRKCGDMIASGAVIGISNGYGEVGPRALGNRSLLARADLPDLAQKVSMECKGREWYRPVAPIMLEELAVLVTGKKLPTQLTRYMLLDCTILPEYQSPLAGVIHAEKSSRIQTINQRSDNPFMFELLTYLYQQYGLLALVNTSFNSQGEPIVHTPQEAMNAAINMNLDAVVINGKLNILN